MRQDEPSSSGHEDREEEQQAEAAAAEAGEIGGPGPADSDDPAQLPLAEAGEGEAEGFELAEEQLEDIASHGDQHRFPDRHVAQPEEPSNATYGEPDQVIPDDE
ncbi:MAG TPA: hypothetical protein VFS26_07675 [Solirubrobacterales bacterium]|nr:hypothetical protein [Solirubrobacterales bacterium]